MLSRDEEFFVLDGAMTINGMDFSAGDYGYHPAGYERHQVVGPDGCGVLTFREPAGADGALIEHLRTRDMPWGSATDATVAGSSVGRKLLRPDSASGERTWMLKIETGPGKPFEIRGLEKHPCVEEVFLLDGDIAMPAGVMAPGAYFWRPADIVHGPMGTRTGFLGFFRAKEGPFSTEWAKAESEIPWDASYDPVLPHEVRDRLIPDASLAKRY